MCELYFIIFYRLYFNVVTYFFLTLGFFKFDIIFVYQLEGVTEVDFFEYSSVVRS